MKPLIDISPQKISEENKRDNMDGNDEKNFIEA